MTKAEFLNKFNELHGGYISVSREVLENFYENFYDDYYQYDPGHFIDLAVDHILSQGLADEVIE